MDELLLRLDEIMANGGDIKMLNQWRTQVSNLRAGVPDVEGAAAGAVLRSVDANIKNAVDNQLLIGDQTAVDAWRNAITNYADYAKTWKDQGGILNLLTETSIRDGSRQLKVAPESAANAIFTMTASGLASKTGLPRDLLTLKAKLPTEQWDRLRQEAFLRLTETLEKVGTGGMENVSGLSFKKAWVNLLKNPAPWFWVYKDRCWSVHLAKLSWQIDSRTLWRGSGNNGDNWRQSPNPDCWDAICAWSWRWSRCCAVAGRTTRTAHSAGRAHDNRWSAMMLSKHPIFVLNDTQGDHKCH
jgi:hypothetical protein